MEWFRYEWEIRDLKRNWGIEGLVLNALIGYNFDRRPQSFPISYSRNLSSHHNHHTQHFIFVSQFIKPNSRQLRWCEEKQRIYRLGKWSAIDLTKRRINTEEIKKPSEVMKASSVESARIKSMQQRKGKRDPGGNGKLKKQHNKQKS